MSRAWRGQQKDMCQLRQRSSQLRLAKFLAKLQSNLLAERPAHLAVPGGIPTWACWAEAAGRCRGAAAGVFFAQGHAQKRQWQIVDVES